MSRKGGLGGQGMNALIKSTDKEIKRAVEEAEKNGILEKWNIRNRCFTYRC